MNIKKQMTLLISCLGLMCASGTSQAGLVLTLNACGSGPTSPTCTRTITDGGTGDMASQSGQIAWLGHLGGWIFNFAAGLSELNPAMLELTSLNATSRSGGTLTITLSNDQFSGPVGTDMTATTSIGGTTFGGNVAFQSMFNTTSLGGLTSNGPAFSGTTSTGGLDTTAGTFTLKQIATITHAGAGVTGFSMITTVPEPATLGLLGIGLIGLAFVRRRQAL